MYYVKKLLEPVAEQNVVVLDRPLSAMVVIEQFFDVKKQRSSNGRYRS
jgi:hypothetical protein